MSQTDDLANFGMRTDQTTDPTMIGNSRTRKPQALEKKQSLTGHFWKLLGNLLLVNSYIFFQLLVASFFPVITISMPFMHTIFLVAFFLFLYLGLRCRIRAKMHKVVNLPMLLATDHRHPVLYLRSFNDDSITSRISVINGRSLFLILSILVNEVDLRTEEEQLAVVLNDIGPFISIGRPGEGLPKVGSTRMYLNNQKWQSDIIDLMLRASLVILRAGKSEGLWWELQTASKLVNPQRLVILLPFCKRRYDRFRKKARTYLPCELPEYDGRKNPFGSIKGIIYFEPDWTPHFVRMDHRLGRGVAAQHLIPMLQMAFRPVFKQLQVSWRSPINYWETYEGLPFIPRWLVPVLVFLLMLYLDIR